MSPSCSREIGTTYDANNNPHKVFTAEEDLISSLIYNSVPAPSKDLICTSQHFKEAFCEKNISDRDEFSTINYGDIFVNRYEVKSFLGEGTFGQVVKAYDHREHIYVAIKIIKNSLPFLNQSIIEIGLLKRLNQADAENKYHIVKIKGHFIWRSHMCLVFELLSHSLHDVLRRTNFRGIPLNLIRKFAYQLCFGLLFLSAPELNIIHCDLKPENILVSRSNHTDLKIADFGSACHINRKLFNYVQSRFYRAPEIILGIPYNAAIDMWSLGCTLAELLTGRPLFPGVDEFDQIHKIVEVLGMPPKHMLDQGQKTLQFFDRRDYDGCYEMKKCSQSEKYKAAGSRTLHDILGVEMHDSSSQRIADRGQSTLDYFKFEDLISQMLQYDPQARITPYYALQHAFFKRTEDMVTNVLVPKEQPITTINTS